MKLFFLIFVFVLSFTFVQNLEAQKKSTVEVKSKAPSRSDFEYMFGQAVDCIRPTICLKDDKKVECPDEKEFICFKDERKIIIKVGFNSSNYAKKADIFDGMNFFYAVRAAEQIIMLNGRGKLLKTDKPSGIGNCESEFTEEYEFLTMQYFSKNCQSSNPGGVTIIWK